MKIPVMGALLIFLLGCQCQCARKVRYRKAAERSRAENDLFGFIARITVDPDNGEEALREEVEVFEEDPAPFTTPPSPSRVVFPTLSPPPPPPPPSRPPAPAMSDYCLSRRGQFPYGPDCHKFVDCWDGRALLRGCHPAGLVFHPGRAQCTWAWDPAVRGRCDPIRSDAETAAAPGRRLGSQRQQQQQQQQSTNAITDFSLPSCSDFSHLGYECVPYYLCRRGQIRNGTDVGAFRREEDVEEHRRLSAQHNRRRMEEQREENVKFTPWTKKCSVRNEVCCKNPEFDREKSSKALQRQKSSSLKRSVLCPEGYSGPQPYPPDCTKFSNCWKGRATVQSCAPGTHFNARTNQCDFPAKAACKPDKRMRKAMQPAVTLDGSLDLEAVARSSSTPAKENIVFPAPPSGQRIRLRGGRSPYSGYLEIFRSGRWGLVCDSGSWRMQEAAMVCKQLGFTRGARSTTQVKRNLKS